MQAKQHKQALTITKKKKEKPEKISLKKCN
jgi:hypothetical protein